MPKARFLRVMGRSLAASVLLALTALPAHADRAEQDEVGGTLLSLFMAGLAHGDGERELPASDAWLALRSQRNMAIDQPISQVMNLASHNAFNALDGGFTAVPFFAPNQIMRIEDQLSLGSRLIELDVYDQDVHGTNDTRLRVYHSDAVAGSRFFPSTLASVGVWLREHPNEVVFLDIEDATQGPEGVGAARNVDLALRAQFGDPSVPTSGSLLFTPADRAGLGRWPTRRELIELGRRVIVFSHRNDALWGRFGEPIEHIDPDGHIWWHAGLSFRTNTGRGNYLQARVDDLPFVVSLMPELLTHDKLFLSMQSDGLDLSLTAYDLIAGLMLIVTNGVVATLGIEAVLEKFIRPNDASRAEPAHVGWAARNNVNFLKMDFLFCHDEDAGLGTNLNFFDDAYEMQSDSRVERLEAAVWSWFPGDDAVQRQLFQDLVPGDGTGALMRAEFEDRLGATLLGQIQARGVAARANGRDHALLWPLGTLGDPRGRWFSATAGGVFRVDGATLFFGPYPYALRSRLRDPQTGRHRWRISTHTGGWHGHLDIPAAELFDDDGYEYAFSGPVNGLENEDLADQRLLSTGGFTGVPVWINVHDTDRDGQWTISAVIALTCPADVTVECGGSLEPDSTGHPRVAFVGTVEVTHADTVVPGHACMGTYTIERAWRARAEGADEVSCVQLIHIQDTTPPVLTLNGPAEMTIECGSPWVEPGAEAEDGCGFGVPHVGIGGDAVKTHALGDYVRTYVAIDDCGNVSEPLQRVVHVVDTTPPVVTLNGPTEVFLECHVDSYVELGATAHDDCDGTITNIDIEGLVETQRLDTYYVGYTATDAQGNKSTQVLRTIHVRDTLAPQLMARVGLNVLWPPNRKLRNVWMTANALDACAGPVRVTVRIYSQDPHGSHPHAPDAVTTPTGQLLLRAEAPTKAGRVYLVAFIASDPSGNTAVRCDAAIVPARRNLYALTQLTEIAAAGRAACEALGGVIPPASGWILLREDEFD